MNRNSIEAGPRLKLALSALALLVFGAACTEIRVGSYVTIINDGVDGTNPYSNNPAAVVSGAVQRCHVPSGTFKVQASIPDLDAIEINGCWLNANKGNVLPGSRATKTATPLLLPDIWIPATPPKSNP